jgi:hypothetical protein
VGAQPLFLKWDAGMFLNAEVGNRGSRKDRAKGMAHDVLKSAGRSGIEDRGFRLRALE